LFFGESNTGREGDEYRLCTGGARVEELDRSFGRRVHITTLSKVTIAIQMPIIITRLATEPLRK
jgi:hypothetical protein